MQVTSPGSGTQVEPTSDGLATVGVVALGRVEAPCLLGERCQFLACLAQGLHVPVEGGEVSLE
jgi:hypothetical protein